MMSGSKVQRELFLGFLSQFYSVYACQAQVVNTKRMKMKLHIHEFEAQHKHWSLIFKCLRFPYRISTTIGNDERTELRLVVL